MALPLFLVAAAIGKAPRVNVDGHNVTRIVIGGTSICGIHFNTDGTVDAHTATASQVDVATDWIIPNSAATTAYQIRITTVVWVQSGDGESFSTAWEVTNTWKAISSTAEWAITQATTDVKEVSFLVEIRFGTGPVLSSGTYVLKAENSA